MTTRAMIREHAWVSAGDDYYGDAAVLAVYRVDDAPGGWPWLAVHYGVRDVDRPTPDVEIMHVCGITTPVPVHPWHDGERLGAAAVDWVRERVDAAAEVRAILDEE